MKYKISLLITIMMIITNNIYCPVWEDSDYPDQRIGIDDKMLLDRPLISLSVQWAQKHAKNKECVDAVANAFDKFYTYLATAKSAENRIKQINWTILEKELGNVD